MHAASSCLILATYGAPARADDAAIDPIPVEFFYEAPARCPDEDYAFSLVHGRTRRVVRVEGSGQRLHMHVTAERSGYRGVLTVRRAGQAPEKRAMMGERCDEVVEALALTAALSIDPDATLTLGPPPEEREDELESRAPLRRDRGTPIDASDSIEPEAGEDEEDEEEEDTQADQATLRFTLGPAFLLERFMDHAVHVGGRLVLAMSAPSSRSVFPFEARLSLEALTEVSPGREPTVVTRLVAVRPVYCPLRTAGGGVLSLCAFSRIGALAAEGRGWEDAGKTVRLFATVGLEGWLRAQMTRDVELWLSPAVGMAVTERRFAVEPGPEVIAGTTGISFGISAGVGWAL